MSPGIPWLEIASLQYLPPVSHGVLSCVSVSVFPSLFLLRLMNVLRAYSTPRRLYHKILHLVTPPKTLFPNKVTFTGTGWTYIWGERDPSTHYSPWKWDWVELKHGNPCTWRAVSKIQISQRTQGILWEFGGLLTPASHQFSDIMRMPGVFLVSSWSWAESHYSECLIRFVGMFQSTDLGTHLRSVLQCKQWPLVRMSP